MKKITHSIKEYVRRKKERLDTLAKYVDGQMFYHVEGLWVDENIFNDTIPELEYKKETKGENPDRTKVS